MKTRNFVIVGLLALVFTLSPVVIHSSHAQTLTIADLEREIIRLTKYLEILRSQQNNTAGGWCHTFNTNLSIGMTGSEVMALQRALGLAGFSDVGSGSFSEATAAAVSGFQNQYRSEVLTPLGLTNPTGYFGPSTRAVMNRLYGCGKPIIDRPPTRPIDQPMDALRIESPNGGEVWTRGDNQRIGWSWKTADFVDQNTNGKPFTIYLTPTNWSPENPQLIIKSDICCTSYYDWEVGKAKNLVTNQNIIAPANSYNISVCAYNNFDSWVCDESNSSFRIVDSESEPTIGKPDLIVRDVYTAVDYLSGDSVNKYNIIVAKVCNQGDAPTPIPLNPTGYFYTQFMFPNGVSQYGSSWDNSGRLLGPNYSVQPGQCFQERAALGVGLQLTDGNYGVKVTADKHGVVVYNNQVEESNEINNSLTKNLYLSFNDGGDVPPAPTTPTLNLSAPLGGSYTVNQNIPVAWSASNIPAGAFFNLKLKKTNGVQQAAVANGVANTVSTYSFVPYSYAIPAGTYYLEVELRNSSVILATASGQIFTITDSAPAPTTPSVNLTAPFANQAVQTNTPFVIRWISANVPNQHPITLRLFNSSDTQVGATVNGYNVTTGDNYYNMVLPASTPAGAYHYRLTAVVGNQTATSNGPTFTVGN